MVKLIVSDLDGTLLVNKVMPSETCEILKKAEKQGIRIALASGRSVNNILNIGNSFDFSKYPNFVIAADGQKVVSLTDNKFKEFERIPYELVLKTLHYVIDNKLFMSINYQDKHYRYTPVEVEDPLRRMMGVDLENRCLIEEIDAPKIGIYDIDDFDINKVAMELSELLGDRVTVYRTNRHFIEITANGINKVNCVKWIQDYLGLNDEEIMIFGDGENDIEMLKRYPNSYAVANALREVKAVANYHIDSNIEQGVGKTIERLLEGKLHD